MHQDGKVELRAVRLGRDFGKVIEVLEGVDSSDRVIVNPSESLENGAAVTILESPATSKKQ